MGRLFKIYLSGGHIYVCGKCKTHLTKPTNLVSKSFQGRYVMRCIYTESNGHIFTVLVVCACRSGKAYLFDKVVNVTSGPKEDRILITGLHTVADIHCKECQTVLGWKYDEAFEPSQKYKEGKFILEKAKITRT
eukprot:TRINITY_DN307_c0_g1_i2.p1 TRINITY_DN307_c0_g1~~TRINITY_DN307_c0_g1_i2.p1  ORF type:complete len:134 (+),score=5.95 TRINITY_DN307_c0_g1_i2:57-458(+)